MSGSCRFARVFGGWPGDRAYANQDVGLIRIDESAHWTAQVYGIGQLGQLVDLHPDTITLDLIGAQLRAFGGASGELSGENPGPLLSIQVRRRLRLRGGPAHRSAGRQTSRAHAAGRLGHDLGREPRGRREGSRTPSDRDAVGWPSGSSTRTARANSSSRWRRSSARFVAS
jgi:hypothetical protein